MNQLAKVVGSRIRKVRESLRISQENFARRVEIARAYYGKIERGKTNITLETLYKICGELGCDPHELLPRLREIEFEEDVLTSLEFNADNYPAIQPNYQGQYSFSKYYYPRIEDMKSNSEEFDCAQTLDSMPEVKRWVRNLPRRDETSFSLTLGNSNIYPDFIAELHDGRILVIECKEKTDEANDDSTENKHVGELHAKHSQDTCLFLRAVKKDNNGQNLLKQLKDII
ncbi:helix-turn-helix domain-containing protein [Thalassotalea sp. PS06]|uniref:helix-turn-helix domain-containing protein n=1 Tax=Thalassotalea sp. PS06 TaxID=2594005 RepID=UPI0021B11972|nr:helix-turn-helix transcriptional regulator [Thalassotalea sp. PS06]